jgi:hypothetical protein
VTSAGPLVKVRYRAGLRDTAGNCAHAATFIRRRLILLDPELKRNPREHRRILLHEQFHFVWVHFSNPLRRQWEILLESEWRARARGEAGWSAEWRKRKLSHDDVISRSRRWREYCCESFCDTGAWFLGRDESEVTLGPRRLEARSRWFQENLPEPVLAID